MKTIICILFFFISASAYSQHNRMFFHSGNVNPATPYDPDALAYFTATGISGATVKDAVNTLVLSLKSSGLWAIGQLINPVAGGTAATHKYNLKDARDLDAAFRIAFFGGWTHNSTGMTPNGSTGYGNTFFTPSVNSTSSLMSMGIYLRTNLNTISTDIGVVTSATTYAQIWSRFGDTYYGQVNTNNSISENVFNNDSRGWFFASRTGASSAYIQRNTTQTTGFATPALSPAASMFVGARSNTGTPEFFSNREISFVWVGGALSTVQAATLYTIIQTYQTALSRQL